MATLTAGPAGRVDAGTTATPPVAWTPSNVLTQVLVLTGRSLRPLRQPGMILASVMEPLIILLLFGGVFRVLGSVPGFPPGVNYIDYLLPAVLVIATLTNGVQSGAALTNDLRNGMVTRLRAVPIRLFSVLLARSFADSARALAQLAVLEVLGVILFGFSPDGGVPGAIGALLIALLVGWSISWLFIAMAAVLRNAQAMQAITTMLTFPLMFASNSFVPINGLPGWLQAVAKVNPVSYANSAARDVALGQADVGQVLGAVTICLALVAVLAPLANWAFRRA